MGVLKPECRKKLKKKKDFTCHLRSRRLGLTAVLFNSSDTLGSKKLDKRTDSGEGKEGGCIIEAEGGDIKNVSLNIRLSRLIVADLS